MNGRNPIFLALLKPGVRGGSLAGFSFDLTTGGLNINGSRTQDNLITYDGAVAVRTRSNGTSIGTADLDQTAEVQVLTASYGAEFGRSSGGQIRVITKSGTAHFHGSAYEYFRNSAMDANTWSRNRNPATNFVGALQVQPVRLQRQRPDLHPEELQQDRNKLFFTWSRGVGRSAAWSRPTFAPCRAVAHEATAISANCCAPTSASARRRSSRTRATGAPFAGNIIPKNRQSPNGMALLGGLPRSATCGSDRHDQLVRHRQPPHRPAQGHLRHRHPADDQRQHPLPRPVLPLPGHLTPFQTDFLFSAADVRPPEPDRIAQLDSHLRPDSADGDAGHGQPRPGVHPHAGYAGV